VSEIAMLGLEKSGGFWGGDGVLFLLFFFLMSVKSDGISEALEVSKN
jgi:hypothetical protein